MTTRPEVTGRRRTAAPTGEADAYSLQEFCDRHRISLQLFYKLMQQGLAPQTFNVGTRVSVSKEAATRWRKEREDRHRRSLKETRRAADVEADRTFGEQVPRRKRAGGRRI